jgi:enediyne biosynthesis protein E4
MLVSLSLLAACQPPGGSGDHSGAGARDSDSGEPIEPIHGPGLTMHGVQVCAEPELRDSLGPLEQPDVGAVWAKQAFEPMGETYPYGPGITVADLEGDGVPEVLLANLDVQLFQVGPTGWTEIGAERFPKHGELFTRAIAPADYDGDGDLDLLIVNATSDLLWRNDGTGHFVDVSNESGMPVDAAPGQSAVWADADGDADLDLFVSNRMFGYGPSPPDPAYANVFYENLGNGTFRDRSELFSEDALLGYTFVAGFDDLDADLDPDLYVVNDFGGMVYGNRYLRNDSTLGDLSFTDATEGSGLELDINGMGLALGDLDGDEIPDMVVTDWGHIHLMDSTDGVWFDTSEANGVRPNLGEDRWLSWGVELVDLDNDGRSDIPTVFAPNGEEGPTILKGVNPQDEPDELYLQQEDGSFVAVGDEWGFAEKSIGRGMVAADIDRDGWLDLFVKSFDEPAHYFHARCGSAAWLQVSLAGHAPNTAGIGARVTVEAGDRTWQQWIRAGGTSMSASGPPIAHFGLGDRDAIDRITVTWRNGATSVYQVIETRQQITIEEP